MSEGRVSLSIEGRRADIALDRPAARNAMTWAMYEQLSAACDEIGARSDLRCVVLRGAGGKAFVAGTDIAQFETFSGAEDGQRYEMDMEVILSKLANLAAPTVAVVEGWAVGGGMALASLCDIRVATPDAKFGLPIARTLGNCLSVRNIARLNAVLGPSILKRLVMLAETLSAAELRDCGYLAEIVEPELLNARVGAIVETICTHAPLTMRATKQAMLRLEPEAPDDSDLVALCYGSSDFKRGVLGFAAKTVPQWTGG